MDFTNDLDENKVIGVLGIKRVSSRENKLRGVGENIILSKSLTHRGTSKQSSGWMEIWIQWKLFSKRNTQCGLFYNFVLNLSFWKYSNF